MILASGNKFKQKKYFFGKSIYPKISMGYFFKELSLARIILVRICQDGVLLLNWYVNINNSSFSPFSDSFIVTVLCPKRA